MNTIPYVSSTKGSSIESDLCQNSFISHCPNQSCPYFHHPPPGKSWYWYHGKYTTKVIGTVNRYLCSHCKKTFSFRTFHIDYYTKKIVDYRAILEHLVTTTGSGNICRLLGLREDLLLNRFERLAQMFLGIHSELREQLIQINPDFYYVLDGFESFSHSQYHPNNINILVGSDKEYLYGMGLSILKRKGSMTKEQKAKRNILEEHHPTNRKETFNSVTNLLQDMRLSLKIDEKPHGEFGNHKILLTDKHPTYVACIRKINKDKVYFHQVQISSKEDRTVTNPLYPVNYVDRQFRKDKANHVRETVQFARCAQAMMTRLTLYLVYHNYLSPYRIKEYRVGDQRSRTERQGLSLELINQVFHKHWGRRLFFHQVKLWAEEEKTWLRKWRNPGVDIGRYVPKYIAV
jgi:transposase-like protein